ncbi:pre-peptidase C-terminal domain-containing protein [Neomesorhizobium albiziae]|nr:pre-peptidase C-terminal domain-containing protein [Mesorhizobium albiziae]GLS29356.1 hypothetical protein GCM10007937_10640 [Mesorhizobium albiziae]
MSAGLGTLRPGGSVTGSIEESRDRDLFAIQLVAGQTYTFNLIGAAGSDPYLRLLNANGGQLAFNDDFGWSLNSRITFTAQTSGTFYLEASNFSSGTGTYTLTSSGTTTTPPTSPSDDYSDRVGDASSPLGALAVGGSRTGRIETSGDTDIFAVTLEAGKTYTLNLSSAASGGLSDPVMRLLNSSGVQLAINDDFGGSRNSQITFTATSSGTYFVEAKAYAASQTGNYVVTARDSTPQPPADDFRDSVSDTTAPAGTIAIGQSSTGRIEVAGDADIFSVSLVAGQTYTFDLRSGATGGLANPNLRLLGSNGVALATNDDAGGSANSQIVYTATTSGTFYLEATGSGGAGTGSYTVAATNNVSPPDGEFDIVVNYSGDARFQAAFDEAAARWEQVIVADLPDVNTSSWGLVDDLLIDASVIAIDGPSNVLGRAGPDALRSGSSLPYHGIMEFDSADMATMLANGTLVDVILHEMGHVLGLGTLWSQLGLKSGNFQYIGESALAEYRTLSGQANAQSVPLETGGGAGTAGGHWAESVFGGELMTGYANGSMAMSRMTIASLEDMGYGVDYSTADPYTLPPALLGSLQADQPLWIV